MEARPLGVDRDLARARDRAQLPGSGGGAVENIGVGVRRVLGHACVGVNDAIGSPAPMEGYVGTSCSRDDRPSSSPMHEERSVGWHSRDVARAAALVMGIYLLLQLLWFVNQLVIVSFLGVLFGLAVGAGVDRLQHVGSSRIRIRRGLAAAMIVVVFFA